MHSFVSDRPVKSPIQSAKGYTVNTLWRNLNSATWWNMGNCAARRGGMFGQHLQPGTAVWGSPGQPGFPRWRRCWAAESAVQAAAAGAAAPYLSVCLQTSPPKVRNSPEAVKRSETLDPSRSHLKNSEIIYECKDIVIARNNLPKRGASSTPQDNFYACCIHIKANTQWTSAMHSWARPHSKIRGTG